MVLKGNWIAISKVVAPLDTCSAMTAEVAGACILTDVLNLITTKQVNVEHIELCIDHIIRQKNERLAEDSDHVCGYVPCGAAYACFFRRPVLRALRFRHFAARRMLWLRRRRFAVAQRSAGEEFAVLAVGERARPRRKDPTRSIFGSSLAAYHRRKTASGTRQPILDNDGSLLRHGGHALN